MSVHSTFGEWRNANFNTDYPCAIQYTFINPQGGEIHTFYGNHSSQDIAELGRLVISYVFVNGWVCTITCTPA